MLKSRKLYFCFAICNLIQYKKEFHIPELLKATKGNLILTETICRSYQDANLIQCLHLIEAI